MEPPPDDSDRMHRDATMKRDCAFFQEQRAVFPCDQCLADLRHVEDRLLIQPVRDLGLEGCLAAQYDSMVFCSPKCFFTMVRATQEAHIAAEIIRLANGRYAVPSDEIRDIVLRGDKLGVVLMPPEDEEWFRNETDSRKRRQKKG